MSLLSKIVFVYKILDFETNLSSVMLADNTPLVVTVL